MKLWLIQLFSLLWSLLNQHVRARVPNNGGMYNLKPWGTICHKNRKTHLNERLGRIRGTEARRFLQVRGGGDRYYDEYYRRRKDDNPYRNDPSYGSQYQDDQFRDDYNYYDERQPRDRYDQENDRYFDDSPSARDHLPSLSSISSVIKNGDRRIGLWLLGSGTVLTMMGISLLFNKTLMRLGNLCFVAGVPMTIGPGRTAGYFFQPRKSRATACLAFGVFLVFVGWPVFGIALEIFGVLNLFGNMFPVVLAVLKQMPVIGPILSGGSNSRGQSGSKPQRQEKRETAGTDDDYSYGYEEDPYDDDQRQRYYDAGYGRDDQSTQKEDNDAYF